MSQISGVSILRRFLLVLASFLGIVAAGQTILIVEAMKHMNEVAAPRAGRVVEVLVEDGQPVEYGEPLMIIE